MESLFLVIATFCYTLGTIGYLVYLFRDRPVIHQISAGILFCGAVVHAVAIGLRSVREGHLAVTSSHEALSFFALLLVVTYLIIQVRLNLRILGSFVSPLAVIFMLTSPILPPSGIEKTGLLQSGWVFFHITVLFLANSLFALAATAGVMYLLQERQIKEKKRGFFFSRLPNLGVLDRISHQCLLVGFPLMTAGLVAGFAYASIIWHSAWRWDPKEVLSLITWLIYAILIHERLAVGLRGRRAAWLAILGFSAVLITFLGVNLILTGHHTAFAR